WEKQHGAHIFRTIRGIVGDAHDAEEVLQEVLLTAWSWLTGGGTLPDSPEKWLRKIAKRKAIDFYRSRRGEKRRRKPFDESGVRSSVSDPAAERARKGTERMIDALLAAVASLAPSEEMIVSWRFFDSRTAEEIATHLCVHDNTVRNRRARALD